MDKLRAANALTLSLVAIEEGCIVGHIAFSPVTIESGHQAIAAIGLAPMQFLLSVSGAGSALN